MQGPQIKCFTSPPFSFPFPFPVRWDTAGMALSPGPAPVGSLPAQTPRTQHPATLHGCSGQSEPFPALPRGWAVVSYRGARGPRCELRGLRGSLALLGLFGRGANTAGAEPPPFWTALSTPRPRMATPPERSAPRQRLHFP